MTGSAGRRDRSRPARSRSFVRPIRPLVPISSAVLVLVGWGVVAHNSGAGWVQALGDVVAGTLLLGILGPAVVLARTRLRVLAGPADGTAGLPTELRVTSTSRLRITPADPPGPSSFAGPSVSPSPDGGDPLTLLPSHRGVFSSVAVDVATAAPFGLLWWTRRLRLDLPSELHVGPKLGPPVAIPPREDDRSGDSAHRSPTDIGEPRGVRPYRPGDSRRWVHWPATAHSGELMVREMEGPTVEPVDVVVNLPPDEEAAERVAERAYGTLVALFDRGTSVILTTVERDGRRSGAVADRRSAGRRLARAVTVARHRDTNSDPDGVSADITTTADAATGVAVTLGRLDGATRR